MSRQFDSQSQKPGFSLATSDAFAERLRQVCGYDQYPVNIERIAAFCDGETGGNPAGVVISEALPDAETMQRIAAEVGYSETAFAARTGEGWRVRYFAPQMEVDFCGHATIALGAALAARFGDGTFALELNHARITVEGRCVNGKMSAALQSPPTCSQPAAEELVREVLELFSWSAGDLDARIPPARTTAGGDNLVLALKSRDLLAGMRYNFEDGRRLAVRENLATFGLIWVETPTLFHARNPFPVGGVYEDPATGSAAAALGGYLRDLDWPCGGALDILQGEEMGMPSRLRVEWTAEQGASVRVSGAARRLQ
jgi:PhzF family phenazine biosynthesis protein